MTLLFIVGMGAMALYAIATAIRGGGVFGYIELAIAHGAFAAGLAGIAILIAILQPASLPITVKLMLGAIMFGYVVLGRWQSRHATQGA